MEPGSSEAALEKSPCGMNSAVHAQVAMNMLLFTAEASSATWKASAVASTGVLQWQQEQSASPIHTAIMYHIWRDLRVAEAYS